MSVPYTQTTVRTQQEDGVFFVRSYVANVVLSRSEKTKKGSASHNNG